MHPAFKPLCFPSLNFSMLHKVGVAFLSLSFTYRLSAFCVFFDFLREVIEGASQRGRGRQGRTRWQAEWWEPRSLSNSISATKMEVDGRNSQYNRRTQNRVQRRGGCVTGMPEQYVTADDSQFVGESGGFERCTPLPIYRQQQS